MCPKLNVTKHQKCPKIKFVPKCVSHNKYVPNKMSCWINCIPEWNVSQYQRCPKINVSQNEMCPKIICIQKLNVSQNKMCPKLTMSQNQMSTSYWLAFSCWCELGTLKCPTGGSLILVIRTAAVFLSLQAYFRSFFTSFIASFFFKANNYYIYKVKKKYLLIGFTPFFTD